VTEIQPEEVLHSKTAFQGKLIDLRVDTVRLPNGKETDREVVVHPEVVAMLPVLEDGRLVLVRQFREAVGRTLLEAPAGGIDGDETPEEAARREMKEETGYDVGSLDLVSTFYTSPGFLTEKMYLFLVRDLAPGTPTEENDQLEVVLMTPEEAWEAVERGEMADAKSILALALYRG
jgi:ADP-ribose pyrophosphatase